MFYNAILVELVFEFGSAAAAAPIRNFSVKPGPYAAYAKFSQNFNFLFFFAYAHSR